ncbi:hypothetical protein CLAIMM_05857 [Cladophialophora immunda]|nr:hypothetical protein CLAIMM_05857 [Cladophialophora immunda]
MIFKFGPWVASGQRLMDSSRYGFVKPEVKYASLTCMRVTALSKGSSWLVNVWNSGNAKPDDVRHAAYFPMRRLAAWGQQCSRPVRNAQCSQVHVPKFQFTATRALTSAHLKRRPAANTQVLSCFMRWPQLQIRRVGYGDCWSDILSDVSQGPRKASGR